MSDVGSRRERSASLAGKLARRPDKATLMDQNILKDDSLHPAMQRAYERMAKERTRDELQFSLMNRPAPEEVRVWVFSARTSSCCVHCIIVCGGRVT